MGEITKRQEDVLTFVKKFIAKKGYSPSIREVCDGLGLKSPATVYEHIMNLQKLGYVKKAKVRARSLEINGQNEYTTKIENIIRVPLVKAKGRKPVVDRIESPVAYITFPTSVAKGSQDYAAIEVNNNDMIDAGLLKGDILAIRLDFNQIRDGQIVILIDDYNDSSYCIRKYYHIKGYTRLEAANETIAPIECTDCNIIGVVEGMYRLY